MQLHYYEQLISRYAEAYHKKYGKFDNQIYKQLKQELADVQKEEQELDRTRHLPLYGSKATGYKLFCSSCWEGLFTKSKSETERKQLKDSRDVLIFSLGILGKRQILVFIDIIIVILFIRKLSATIGVIMGYNIS